MSGCYNQVAKCNAFFFCGIAHCKFGQLACALPGLQSLLLSLKRIELEWSHVFARYDIPSFIVQWRKPLSLDKPSDTKCKGRERFKPEEQMEWL